MAWSSLEEEMSEATRKVKHLSHTKKIRCNFCKGTGKDPFGQLYPGSTCQVCNGRKEIYVSTPYNTCTYCHGRGVAFSMQNTCTICNGRGVVSIGKSEVRKGHHTCTACQGSGMEIETNLPCTKCHGTGVYVSP